MATTSNYTNLGAFDYASLSTLMVYWQVSPDVVTPLLDGTGLEVAQFGGSALACLNFERYAGAGDTYFSPIVETEFSVVTHPVDAHFLPDLAVGDFLGGADETKVYGHFRVHVACNDATAVQAGSQKYGEIKFLTSYDYKVSNINAPSTLDWWIRCRDPKTVPPADAPYIFDLHANFQSVRPQISPFSPVVAYANLVGSDGEKRMVLSSRNVFGNFQRWAPTKDAVQLRMGDSPHVMTQQMKKVFAKATLAGILLYESPPAATSSHALVTEPIAAGVA